METITKAWQREKFCTLFLILLWLLSCIFNYHQHRNTTKILEVSFKKIDMTHSLKGKIYWVLDAFAFTGTHNAKKTTHGVANIDRIIIEDYMISFYVMPSEFEGETFSYNVNLLSNNSATKYNGKFTKEDDLTHDGAIEAELYSNREGYFLYGKWIEVETVFTFWVKIKKEYDVVE